MNTNIIVYAIPFFLLMIGLELLVSRWQHKQLYELNDTVGNLFSGISEQALSIFLKSVLLVLSDWVRTHFALFDIPNTWWSFLLLFFMFDFIYYWAHRFGHEINFLWGSHIVHHQSQRYNLSVALRQPWFLNNLVFVLFLPIPLLGFNILTFAIVGGISTLYQFWIHTQTIGFMPRWFEYFFNTPSHHRVHHGRNKQYLDKNYGAVFIIWDRLLGTFAPEKETVEYGITVPFSSKNAVWANTYYWILLWQDIKNIPNWRKKWQYIIAPPEKLTTLYKNTLAMITESRREAAHLIRIPTTLSWYVVMQCVVVIIGLSAALYYENSLAVWAKLLITALIIYSTLTAGGLLDGKRWAITAEYVRMAFMLGIIAAVFYTHTWLVAMLISGVLLAVVSVVWVSKYRLVLDREV